jgi:hypothetical protein
MTSMSEQNSCYQHISSIDTIRDFGISGIFLGFFGLRLYFQDFWDFCRTFGISKFFPGFSRSRKPSLYLEKNGFEIQAKSRKSLKSLKISREF